MTKQELLQIISEYGEYDEIDLAEIMREQEERRQALIEEIEEWQHNSGFYVFQDTIEMYRRER